MLKKNVYIIGSKGIPANYGGFETFVEKLTEYNQDQNIQFHIACMKENSEKSNIVEKEFIYNGAKCFNIDVPNIGPAKAIYYDIKSLEFSISKAKKNNDIEPIFYILACRIGPFIYKFKKQIEKIGGKLYVNPDGHEWLREKWSYPVRKYWKLSEKLMVKHSDLLVCDSLNIEKYILSEYRKYKPKTKYIAYGTDLKKSQLNIDSDDVKKWFMEKKIKENHYFLIVGRFVPENNYETIIKEFMKSSTNKDLVIVTNVEQNKFYKMIEKSTAFVQDNRIKFVGTVYNQELLKYIRQNAYAYIHGHEVGGTNPSLLEAMFSTKLNLLLDVGFNKEVGRDSCLYWNKEDEDLRELILETDNLSNDERESLDKKSIEIISSLYNWNYIVNEYEQLFTK
ncbi:beta 1-4 rhamnosyltransferase Cps2T [Vagococcus fluvialis]|uniref:beta 1-4 rhamnosyltransferase Cps2T n=1 Tax=Vagococcus fluvialis TaxID=2738 RepID=UPI003B5BEC83